MHTHLSKPDKRRLLVVMEKVLKGELKGIKLKDKNQYRIRVGKYRIKYSIKTGQKVVNEIRRRNEKTCKN
jgi:mRNA-degrading endonuclease RelE of RelBE toxin-antitoxin system